MLQFAEIVAEHYESTEVALVWTLKSLSHAVATFEVAGVSVSIDFERREPEGPWHVGFNVGGSPPISSAFRIFNGVFQAVEEFITTRQPATIVFVAKDDDVATIYRTYLRRERAVIERMGYDLESPVEVAPFTQWTLRRKRASQWQS